MNTIDLHTHSNCSDGTLSPTELVQLALKKGLKYMALTDHDTIDGIEEAVSAAKGTDLQIIPGIEFSTGYEGCDIHIVGLFMDCRSPFLQRRLRHFIDSRTTRNMEMCKKLTEHGMPLTYDELVEAFPDSVITRAHYGKILLKKGYVKSIKEAFDRYIGDNGPCFIPRKKITPMRAIEIILKSGGFPILAHPLQYHMGNEKLSEFVGMLKCFGLQGMEVFYSTHSPSQERQLMALAKKYNLLPGGGSDFHGSNKPDIDLGSGKGHLYIPEEVFTNIKAKHEEIQKHPEGIRPKKILFTDLDGTLLKSDKTISDYTYSVLKKWTREGNRLVLSSGRDINSVKKVRTDLKLDFEGVYLIGYNGGLIYDCTEDKILYRCSMPLEQVKYIEQLAEEHHIHFHTYTDQNIISKTESEELSFYRKVIKTPVLYSKEQSVTDFMEEGPCKCLVIELHDKEKLEAFKSALKPYAEENHLSLVMSNPWYLEIFPSRSGKGAAIQILCDKLGINPLFSVAAGDEENDRSMIEQAGIGIAMCVASEEIKNAATVVTDFDSDHDGLALTLVDLM